MTNVGEDKEKGTFLHSWQMGTMDQSSAHDHCWLMTGPRVRTRDSQSPTQGPLHTVLFFTTSKRLKDSLIVTKNFSTDLGSRVVSSPEEGC